MSDRVFETRIAKQNGIKRGVRVGIKDGRLGRITGSQDYHFHGARSWIVKLDDGDEVMSLASDLEVVTKEYLDVELEKVRYDMVHKMFNVLNDYKNGVPVDQPPDIIEWLEEKFNKLKTREDYLIAELNKPMKAKEAEK